MCYFVLVPAWMGSGGCNLLNCGDVLGVATEVIVILSIL